MHGRFRYPFGGPPPVNFMNFERPPWVQHPPMPPPCRYASFGPPQSHCDSFPRPPFPPPRGGHSFGRGIGGFHGRGRGFNGPRRGFFHDRGTSERGFDGRGRGGDYFRGRGGLQVQKKKVKKEKVDKRDLAENNVFRCDSCDRGFKTKEIFEKHVSEHEQCPFEGCGFIAAPKLVKIHVKCQHVETNIVPLVWKSVSPEELEQWKAERRRHYPTKGNVAREKAEAEARTARGELLKTKYFGKMRGRGGMRGQRGGREGRGRGVQGKDRRKRAAEEDGDTPPAKRFTPSPPQDGHESRLEDRTRSLMANDAVSNGSVKTPLDEKASKALASIASAYDGDSNNGDGGDSDDEAPEELDIGRMPLGVKSS